MATWKHPTLHVAIIFAAASCQVAPAGPTASRGDGPVFAVDQTPEVLTRPRTFDWTFHAVAGRNIQRARGEHAQRELLAYPTKTDWPSGLTATQLGCASATDTFPNGPAAVFYTKTTPTALQNTVFFLSKAGRLVRVNKTFVDTATSTKGIDLGKTFTKTFVTLSPSAHRAYVVSDDGTLFIVDTQAMTLVVPAVSLGAGAYGTAPVFDPVTALYDGSREDIFIPTNDGVVRHYRFTRAGTSFTSIATYNVATSITTHPRGDATRKIKAPAIVYDQVIYVGDQEGRMNVYDIATPSNSVSYPLGAPVNTAPAIEIQDGTYSLTDPSGAAKTVTPGKAVYAFVTAGYSAHWVNLHSQTSSRSKPLYLDDNNTAKTYGYLHDYGYEADSAGTAVELTLSAKCSMRTDSTANLAGYTSYKMQDYLAAAEVDANNGNDGNYSGGPVHCYMRWSTSTATAAVVKYATIELAIENGSNKDVKVQEFRACPSYLRVDNTTTYTTTLWDFDNITVANRPLAPLTTNDSVYLGPFAKDTNNNIRPLPSSALQFDISNVFLGAAAAHYSMIMLYNAANTVLWPPGDRNAAGNPNSATDYTEAGYYRISGNATTAPTLTLGTSTGSFTAASIETPAVIDPVNKCVYVFFGNALYQCDFTSTTTWADDSAATKKTLFNSTYWGRSVSGKGGASYNSRAKYVSNYSAPVFNYDMSACYVLDRTPDVNSQASPTVWDYSLSKFTLPLSSAADKLQTGSTPPLFDNVTDNSDTGTYLASSFLIIDPFSNVTTTGGNVFLGLGSTAYQIDR